MSQRQLIALIVASVLTLGALWTWLLLADVQPRLGLDLQGGVSANMIPAEGQGEIDTALLDQTVSIIRDRVDALGVAEPDIARQGETIQIQLPGVADAEQAQDIIGRTAQLQFRPVLEQVMPGQGDVDCTEAPNSAVPPADEEVTLCLRASDDSGEDLPRELWTQFRLGPVAVSGADLSNAEARLDPNSLGQNWYTALEFDSAGADRFEQVTAELACEQGPQRQLAIVLDAVIEQAPPIAQEVPCGEGIGGGEAIVQNREETEAKNLALVLRAGALPIEMEFGTFQSVSPTLGSESLRAGLWAGALGLLLVAVYLILLYRGMGVAAVTELLFFGATTYGLLLALGYLIGFTLTLAGIAGVIVSIGIAADSSIIYRERYRDEVRNGRTIRTAADHAWDKAFRTNLSGNFVSFLAAVVLYFLAVGPVRGFAFTLGLSTVIDTVLFATFTRGLFGLLARSKNLANASWSGLTTGITAEQLEAAQSRTGAVRRSRKKGRANK